MTAHEPARGRAKDVTNRYDETITLEWEEPRGGSVDATFYVDAPGVGRPFNTTFDADWWGQTRADADTDREFVLAAAKRYFSQFEPSRWDRLEMWCWRRWFALLDRLGGWFP